MLTNTAELAEDGYILTIARDGTLREALRSEIHSHLSLPNSPAASTETVLVGGSLVSPCAYFGDSGAFTLVKDSETGGPAVAGVMIGGNQGTNWGYMTPIKVVFRDIEQRLGCRVALPPE
jgi:hypothetical protein